MAGRDGLLTLGYQSSSYLTARVPELGVLDLPFLFRSEEAAQRAMDGRLGAFLAGKIEEHAHFRILGWFENGFRHVSNRVRPVHKPADLAGMRVRVLPSKVQARTFELMGAVPMPMDLTQAIELIKSGEVDAQENPLTNTVTYGVHKFHRFHTLTRHFYISRPIFLHRPTFDGWPEPVKAVMRAAIAHAVTWQRQQHGEEEKQARETIAAEGCQIAELALAEQEAFACAVSPLREEAVQIFGAGLLALAAAR
jgi:TRAP-type C4-dicarboxylate transport system substrate-binding protein